jgi:hypothetical protein
MGLSNIRHLGSPICETGSERREAGGRLTDSVKLLAGALEHVLWEDGQRRHDLLHRRAPVQRRSVNTRLTQPTTKAGGGLTHLNGLGIVMAVLYIFHWSAVALR